MKIKRINRKNYKWIIYPVLSMIGIIIVITWTVSNPINNFSWKGIRESIRDSVLIIAKNPDYISCGTVGDPAKTPEVYKTRIWVIKNANEFELKRLIDFPANNIKVSAFHGMILKGDSSIYDNLISILNDTTSYLEYHCGCEGYLLWIGEYCVNHIPKIRGNETSRKTPDDYKIKFSKHQLVTIDSIYNNTKIKKKIF